MISPFLFEIKNRSSLSKARRGRISTPRGNIETPAFVTVGTKGTVKGLTPEDLDITGTQFVFANTYHLVLSPTLEVLQKAGGIHKMSKINKPMITDSGGFQVFSLAGNRDKELKGSKSIDAPTLVKINNDGVTFRSHIDGATHVFTPEFSIDAQKTIGADFIVAFDECVYRGANEKYTKKSMERTHEWAKRSLEELHVPRNTSYVIDQQMYGVIQGGMYKSLRQQSAQYVAGLPFWGLAVGGISVGETKNEMREQMQWVMEAVQDDKRPVHALGIGHLDDIVDMVKMGVDTFDCIVPTRDARVGMLYTSLLVPRTASHATEIINILKSDFKNDLSPIDLTCQCYTCANFSRAYIHHLFKQRELLAYRLATIHNLFWIEKFFEDIRCMIDKNQI